MASVNANTSFALIDTSSNPGVISLPSASEVPGRVLTFKDKTGTFTTHPLTLQTTGSDTFENGQTTKVVQEAYGTIQLIASGTTWYTIAATQTPQSAIDTLSTGKLTNSLRLGSTSSLTTIAYSGLISNYTNTVLAELQTPQGEQEFLVFKGSSITDRVRVQTTGSIVFEPGVSSRLFDTLQTQAQAVPALLIDSSSNVGIQTATPQTALDVKGTGRFTMLSTSALHVGALHVGIWTV